jgi:glycosyltransferase involved in cell wall biosynthesis
MDDGSADNTRNLVRSFQDVELVNNAHGVPSVARDLGAKTSSGEIIAFTDSDCSPTSKCLEDNSGIF